MTGTSINPLLRAASLAAKGFRVSLILPWLEVAQQPKLFPAGLTFAHPEEQEAWIRAWLHELRVVADGGGESDGRISFVWYAGIYEDFLGAIIQRQGVDLARLLPEAQRDVAILEEPEHLNWYHHGARWTDAYAHVVGVLHTNYLYYARNEERSGGAGEIPPAVRERIMASMNNLVCAAHVDVGIKLSRTLPDVACRTVVCNVHGVRADFLAVGGALAALPAAEREAAFSGGAYFLGKALWTKGYRVLLDEWRRAAADGVEGVPAIDAYGSGRDEGEIAAAVERDAIAVSRHPAIDHAHPRIHPYRVFVNPSTSEVLCTATAEALAMGKKVLIPRHACNQFFEAFTNAVVYDSHAELLPRLLGALEEPPAAMSPKEQYLLSWEAATERLLDAARLPDDGTKPRESARASAAYRVHHAMLATPALDDYFRQNSGASPQSQWSTRRLAALARGRDER